MSQKSRSVTIIVHRDGDITSPTLRIPLWLLRLATVVGIVILGLILIGGVLYGPIVRTAARVPGLTSEVARLREDNARVRQLAATLRDMERRYDQVRTMLGGNIVPSRPSSDTAQLVARPIVVTTLEGNRRYPMGPTIPRFWPLDERGIITRGTVPSGAGEEAHSGLDIAVPVGTPIRASGGGIVAEAGADPQYGLFVLLEHPDAYRSMYGHASRLLVAPGDTVQAGQVIALSGSTGRSTAPHLHFEITRAGESIDPRTIVPEEN
jgi:murein DD-endopeptidase MepM/ murein hydrolase activator NlpD